MLVNLIDAASSLRHSAEDARGGTRHARQARQENGPSSRYLRRRTRERKRNAQLRGSRGDPARFSRSRAAPAAKNAGLRFIRFSVYKRRFHFRVGTGPKGFARAVQFPHDVSISAGPTRALSRRIQFHGPPPLSLCRPLAVSRTRYISPIPIQISLFSIR